MTLKIVLTEDEYQALEKYASDELRRPQSQALLIIRLELLRLGYLPIILPKDEAQP